jgi:hypothetical protein
VHNCFSLVIASNRLYMSHCSLEPSPRPGSHSIFPPVAPAAPSLKLLVPRGSLMTCQSVQMYHHHPRSRVPSDTVHHIVYLRYYPVRSLPKGTEVWAICLSCGLGDRATVFSLRSTPRSWPVCHNEFPSGHWPASGVDGFSHCLWYEDTSAYLVGKLSK